MSNTMSSSAEVVPIPVRFPHLRGFWILWIAVTLANLADGIFKLVLPLLATRITTSPGRVAGVAFAVRLPWLLFALFAGAIADRLDRRRMMVVANIVRVITLSLLVSIIILDRVELWILYGVAFVLGIAETMADTAGASILPSIVPREDLEKANSRLVGAITVTNEFIGPPLGGAIAAISLALAFATSSALYLLAALALLLLIGTFHPTKTSRPHLLTDIVAGMKYVWREPLLRTLVIIVGVMNLGWSAWLSVMVLYMVEPGPGGLSELGFGLMLTSIGIGGFLGALITVPLVNRFGRRWAIGADISGTLLMLAIPAVTANVWLIGGAAIFGGIGGSMWSIVVSSIRQQMVPDDMLGRTSGVFTLFGYGALPLGAALAGLIGEVVSIPAVFAICSGLTALLFMPFLRYITPTAIERTGALLR